MTTIGNEELERRFDDGEGITEFMDMSTMRRPNQIGAGEFDRLFDEGGGITPYLDQSSKRRPNREHAERRRGQSDGGE